MRATLRSMPVLLMILLAPLHVYDVVLPGSVRLTVYFALIVGLLPLFLFHVRPEYPLPVYLLLIFCVWSTLGVLLAGGHWAGYRGVSIAVFNLLALVYTLTFIRDSKALEAAISMVIVAGLLSAVMGMTEFISFVFLQKIVHPPFAGMSGMEEVTGYGFGGGLMRMHGFFRSGNRLGSALLVPFGFSLYRSFHGTAHRRVYGLISGFFFITILFALSRNAYVGLLIIVGTLCVGWAKTFQRGFLLAAMAVGVVGFLYANPETGFEPLDRTNPFFHQQAERPLSAGSSFTTLWTEHAWAALIGSARTGGIGMGVQNFDEWAYQEQLVADWGSHSNFILFLGESGVVGLLCQVLITVFICRLCWRRYQMDRRAGLPPFFLYLLAMYLGLVSTGITRTFYYVETSYIFIGLILQARKWSFVAAPSLTIAPELTEGMLPSDAPAKT